MLSVELPVDIELLVGIELLVDMQSIDTELPVELLVDTLLVELSVDTLLVELSIDTLLVELSVDMWLVELSVDTLQLVSVGLSFDNRHDEVMKSPPAAVEAVYVLVQVTKQARTLVVDCYYTFYLADYHQ